MAVGAVGSSGAVSIFATGGGSNSGTTADGGVAHDLVFFAPGGGGSEYVDDQRHDKILPGNVLRRAYAAALFAHYFGRPTQTRGRRAALDYFADNAKSGAILNHSKADHGHGLIHLP